MTDQPAETTWGIGSVDLTRYVAGKGERRLAIGMAALTLVVFIGLIPFAQVKLAAMPFFISVYESVLVITDLLTVMLLLNHFSTTRDAALVPLMCGYLFTAGTAVVHALSYPGLFAAGGLMGAGPQTTAWLYMFWHGGFPLCVIAYALTKNRGHQASGSTAMLAALTALGLVAMITTLTIGDSMLPDIMAGNGYKPLYPWVVGTVWVLSLIAVPVLWRYRSTSVLDTWLLVVMCAWVADVGLSAVLNAGRFDLGFYAGRIYGLIAASFILVVLFEPRGLNRYRA
jgi:hypothetical protein